MRPERVGMTALYALPAWLMLLLAVAAAVGIALGGQILVHRRLRPADFVASNDVAGFMITVVGTLYAVVLGFITVIVWQEFDASQQRVAAEAAAATDVWHMANSLPAPAGPQLKGIVVSYARAMVGDEWPAMQRGRTSRDGGALLERAYNSVGGFSPADFRSSNLQAAILRRLNEVHDDRRRRLQDNQSGVASFEWFILLIGAMVVIGFCYIFGVKNTRAHLIMTSAVAMIIMVMVVLIFELDYPFRGDLAVTSEPWTTFLSEQSR